MNKNKSWSAVCMSRTIGSERMEAFTQWLIDNNKRAFLGEFSANDDEVCLAAVEDQTEFTRPQEQSA